MSQINFELLQSDNPQGIELVAQWYFQEWNIPVNRSVEKLHEIISDLSQFQIIMYVDGVPVSTGGIYNHVSLLDKEPRLKIYKNWLALIYTIPEKRHQGYGFMICQYIQEYSKSLNMKELYLFTDTAEKLYHRLGWKTIEHISIGERDLALMNIKLP
jgi:N-acetylglutamate synthase-like GNAT family acetyltransferase